MGNVQVLTDAEVLVRNERRRQDEKYGGPANDDRKTQEEWRHVIRGQVNRMVELDEAILNRTTDVDPFEDYVVRWTKIAATANAAIEAMTRTGAATVLRSPQDEDDGHDGSEL